MNRINRKDIFSVLIVALCISILIRLFVFDVFTVKGDSMAPTIDDGEIVVISKLAYAFEEPQRGDIIVVIPRKMSEKILKRVVGLPEERVEIEENRVVIKKDRTDEGSVLLEEYLKWEDAVTDEKLIINIDPREYFVLGDNRGVSTDSRDLGPVDDWKIKGKVVFALNWKKLSVKPF